MTLTRVSTSFQNQTSLRQLQLSQSNLQGTTGQITTGFRSDRLGGFADDANTLLDLKDVQNNTQSYLNNITTAQSRISASESALQGFSDILEEAANIATLARTENSSSTRAAIAPSAEALVNSFFDILNTQFDGRFIFSGSNGSEAPTNDTPTATAFPGLPAPTDYYTGDSNVPRIISGAGTTTEYGVAGNEPAIAELKAALEALQFGLENNSEADIDNAIVAFQSAQTGVSSLLGDVGGQLNSLSQLEERHQNTNLFLEEQISSIEQVDVAEAITQFSQQEAVLQASLAVIARLNQISLLNFL